MGLQPCNNLRDTPSPFCATLGVEVGLPLAAGSGDDFTVMDSPDNPRGQLSSAQSQVDEPAPRRNNLTQNGYACPNLIRDTSETHMGHREGLPSRPLFGGARRHGSGVLHGVHFCAGPPQATGGVAALVPARARISSILLEPWPCQVSQAPFWRRRTELRRRSGAAPATRRGSGAARRRADAARSTRRNEPDHVALLLPRRSDRAARSDIGHQKRSQDCQPVCAARHRPSKPFAPSDA